MTSKTELERWTVEQWSLAAPFEDTPDYMINYRVYHSHPYDLHFGKRPAHNGKCSLCNEKVPREILDVCLLAKLKT